MKPTSKDLWNWEEFFNYEEVSHKVIDTWRHGSVHELVVEDTLTGKLWACTYRRDKDGDYNSARDEGPEDAYEVRAVEKTVIEYEPVREAT